jgi:uncharacterized delta-60 repeat protein
MSPWKRISAAFLLALPVAATVIAGAVAAAGDLDSTFSDNGKVTTRFKARANIAGGVAVQPDGKIVVAGGVDPAPVQRGIDSKFALLRYNADGTLDTSFGGDGKVTTNLTRTVDLAEAVAIQANGKIVVVGRASPDRGGKFAVVRYKPDGGLDKSFSADGKKITDFTRELDIAYGVALQGDGKIVVVGGAGVFTDSGRFALARYNRNGGLDTTFGGDGKVMTNFTARADSAYDVAIQADGRIVAAGGAATFTFTEQSSFALARYNADGTLDAGFDMDGKRTTDFGSIEERATGVAIQADGKIVAAGTSGQTGGPSPSTDSKFALARYNTNGTPDGGFDGDGLVTTNFTVNPDGAEGGLAIQADGKIVAAGHAESLRFALARYGPNGTLDPTFSGDGKVTTQFGSGGRQHATGVRTQTDGKIVAAGDVGGSCLFSENCKFAVARYLGG